MDWPLTHALNGLLARHDGLEDAVGAYSGASELLFALGLVALLVLAHYTVRRDLFRAGIAAAASTGLALLVTQVVTRIVDRPRPFVAHPQAVHLFAAHAPDPGFPSDHATAAFALGTALALRRPRLGAAVLALALLLAVARVGLGVHYPGDVLAGAGVGAFAALALFASPVRARLDALADLAASLWASASRALLPGA